MPANWDFIRRVSTLDRALGGAAPREAARVQIVSDNRYLGSRERAPIATHFQSIPALGAGKHAAVILSGNDRAGPGGACWVYPQHFQVAANNLQIGLVPQSTVTFDSVTAATPLMVDVDEDVTPLISNAVIDVANLPASGTAGWADIWPGGTITASTFPIYGGMNFRAPDRVLIIIGLSANSLWVYRAMWQAVRM